MRLLLIPGFVALAVVAGCGNRDEGRVVGDANTQQTETRRLETNEHLPPQARAASVQMMQRQQQAARMAAQLPRR